MKWWQILIITAGIVAICVPIVRTIYNKKNNIPIKKGKNKQVIKKDYSWLTEDEKFAKENGFYVYSFLIENYSKQKNEIMSDFLLKNIKILLFIFMMINIQWYYLAKHHLIQKHLLMNYIRTI